MIFKIKNEDGRNPATQAEIRPTSFGGLRRDETLPKSGVVLRGATATTISK